MFLSSREMKTWLCSVQAGEAPGPAGSPLVLTNILAKVPGATQGGVFVRTRWDLCFLDYMMHVTQKSRTHDTPAAAVSQTARRHLIEWNSLFYFPLSKNHLESG